MRAPKEWMYLRTSYNIVLALSRGLDVEYNLFGQSDSGFIRVNGRFSEIDERDWQKMVGQMLLKGNFRIERRTPLVNPLPRRTPVNTPDVVDKRAPLLSDAQVVGMIIVTVIMVVIFVFGPVALEHIRHG